jgi:hypothetical protein
MKDCEKIKLFTIWHCSQERWLVLRIV